MLARFSRSFLAATAVFSTSVAGLAHAETCRQDLAIYQSGDYELAFFQPKEKGATTHSFTLKRKDSATVMNGMVMDFDDPPRSNGMAMYQCPDGDMTGDDIAACTGWDGFIYAVGQTAIGNLPKAADPAADRLLLAGLGPSLKQSSLWSKLKYPAPPEDEFKRTGCAPSK